MEEGMGMPSADMGAILSSNQHQSEQSQDSQGIFGVGGMLKKLVAFTLEFSGIDNVTGNALTASVFAFTQGAEQGILVLVSDSKGNILGIDIFGDISPQAHGEGLDGGGTLTEIGQHDSPDSMMSEEGGMEAMSGESMGEYPQFESSMQEATSSEPDFATQMQEEQGIDHDASQVASPPTEQYVDHGSEMGM